jgi:hypothetical protein
MPASTSPLVLAALLVSQTSPPAVATLGYREWRCPIRDAKNTITSTPAAYGQFATTCTQMKYPNSRHNSRASYHSAFNIAI